MVGFEFAETMAGSFHPASNPGDARSISFTIRVRSKSLSSFLRRPVADIEGEVDVEQFADHRYLCGTLGLDLLRKKTIPYAFAFTANDGARYVFEGMKTLARGALLESMTVLPAVVRDAEGKEIGRALLRFDLRSDLGRFLRSFKAVF